MLAWKDADVLDEINKIYTAKYNTDLEEDLISASDSKHHPVIQVCMSENRDDEEDWSQVDKSVKVLSRAVEEHDAVPCDEAVVDAHRREVHRRRDVAQEPRLYVFVIQE